MALSCLMRGAASKVNACPMQILTKQSVKLCTGPASASRGLPLFSLLARSHVVRKPATAGLGRLQIKQVQNFSVSPKSYSAGGSHNHSKLWSIERILSGVLLVVVPAALIAPNKAADIIAAVCMVMHSHWGVEACVIDYVRPILFGNTIPKLALGGVYLLSFLTLAGLLNLIYNDIGLANTVKKIWKM